MKHPLSIFLLILFSIGIVKAQNAYPKVQFEHFADIGFFPTDIANAGDDRLFIVRQQGYIEIVDTNGNISPTPFLNINSKVSCCDELGLLGLVFHPDFPDSNYFYISYTDKQLISTVVRYEVSDTNANAADTSSEMVLLTLQQPNGVHNGGDLNFGPDGMLYIGFGDGGANRILAQDSTIFLGKMLRIDVDGGTPYAIPPDNPYLSYPNIPNEVWAFGLRNPWRFSFDDLTGDLWIADVGNTSFEEINIEPVNDTGGHNYGWPCWEASDQTNVFDPPCKTVPNSIFTFPEIEYGHGPQGCSVTGGYVYRGTKYPNMQGWYIYGDYCAEFLHTAKIDSTGIKEVSFPISIKAVTTFGVDKNNEIYFASANPSPHTVNKIVDACNGRKVDATVSGSHCTADTGGAISLTPVNLKAPVDYSWSTNATSKDVTSLVSGSYTVTITDADTCIIEYTITVPVGNFSVDAGNNASICEGENITLSASNADLYSWQPSAGLDDTTLQNPTASPAQSTTYYVTATDSTGCSAMDSVMVTVIDTPQPGITLSNDTLLASNGVTYLWYKDGIELSGETNAYYTPVSSGNYSVEVTDANGCVGLSAPFNYTVGIANFIHNNLKLYPNPASTLLNIQLPDSKPLSVQVINLAGKVIDETKIKGNTTLNIQHYPPGVYLLKLLAKDEVVYRKWVKGR